MSTKEVVERLYGAFARRDGDGMAACYADAATFWDPVFLDLDGAGVRAMWRMLTSRATDLEVTLDGVDVDGDRATARWTARYTFAATGKKVVNKISSAITVAGDRVIKQRDSFDFPAWARQAFGFTGRLLGGTGFFRRKVQKTAAANLEAYRSKQAAITRER